MFRNHIAHLFRYLPVGGVAALMDWFIFWVLTFPLEIYFIYSATISFVIATLANYFLGIKFIFISETRFSKKGEIFLVYLVSSIGLVINLLALTFASNILGIHLMLSKILASGVSFLWNFVTRAFFIFRER